MIEYSPFWETLKKPLNTTTINDLCRILNCQIQDICQYVRNDENQIIKKLCKIITFCEKRYLDK